MTDADSDQLRFDSAREHVDGADVLVVALEGELDLGVVDVLASAVPSDDGQLGGGVVLDLTKLGFVDSAGIQALVQTCERVADGGRQCRVVVGPGSGVERVLQMTSLLDHLDTDADRDAALAAIRNSGPGSPSGGEER